MLQAESSLYELHFPIKIKIMSLSTVMHQKLVDLRKKGKSVPEISRECGLPKSTVSRHIKGTKILPEYHARWLERRNASKIVSERNWQIASKKAEEIFYSLSERDKILIAAGLYWAEGTKREFNFINTDPEMIKFFVHVLRSVFHVRNEDFKVTLRIYEDLDKQSCLQYWSEVIGIKLGNDTAVNVLSGFKKGKLKYGMCRVRIKKGGLLHKEFFSIIKRINFLSY